MAKRSNFSESRPRAVGLLGSAVFGGQSATRFVLNGLDVRLYGASADAVERVHKMLPNVRRAYRRLRVVQPPGPQHLRW